MKDLLQIKLKLCVASSLLTPTSLDMADVDYFHQEKTENLFGNLSEQTGNVYIFITTHKKNQ